MCVCVCLCVCVCVCVCARACIIEIQVPHEAKNQRAIAKRTFKLLLGLHVSLKNLPSFLKN